MARGLAPQSAVPRTAGWPVSAAVRPGFGPRLLAALARGYQRTAPPGHRSRWFGRFSRAKLCENHPVRWSSKFSARFWKVHQENSVVRAVSALAQRKSPIKKLKNMRSSDEKFLVFPWFLKDFVKAQKNSSDDSLAMIPGWSSGMVSQGCHGATPSCFPMEINHPAIKGYPHDYGKPQKNRPDIPTFVEVIHQLSDSELAHHRVQTMFKRLDPTVMRPNLHMMMDQPWSHRPLSQLDFTYEFAAKTPLTWWLWSSDTISSPCQFYHFLDMIYNY